MCFEGWIRSGLYLFSDSQKILLEEGKKKNSYLNEGLGTLGEMQMCHLFGAGIVTATEALRYNEAAKWIVIWGGEKKMMFHSPLSARY